MEEKIITLKVKHNLDDVAKKVDDVTHKLEDTNKKVEDIADSTKKAESGIGKMAKAFSGLGLAIKAAGIGVLLEAFQLFKDTIGQNQKVIDLFNTSMTATKMIFSDIVKLISGDLSFKNFFDNLGKSFSKATDTTKLENNAKRAAAVQQGLIEKFDRLAELQRQIRDNDALSIPERIKANERLGQILKLQNAEMQKQAKYQTDAAKVRYDTMPNIENEIALINARNNEAGIAAQLTGLESEQLVNRNALLNEEKTKREELRQKKEEDRLADLARLDAQTNSIRVYEENIAAIEIEAEEERKLRAAEKQKQIEFENSVELNSMATYMGNITAVENEEAEKRKNIAKIEAEAKIGIQGQYIASVMQFAQGLRQISGQNKELAIASIILEQGAAIASIAINANKNFVKDGGVTSPLAWIGLAGSVAAGLAAVSAGAKGIQDIKSGNATGSNMSFGNPQMTPSYSTAPQFNVVGTSGVNQIAQVVGQGQQPVKAYVVASEVSSQQSLDRNKVMSASLG
jgi:hypothetical protein